MGQPHKGDRLLLQSTQSPLAVREAVHARATAAGLPDSQYLADVLALHVGRPDLVRDLDKQGGLALNPDPLPSTSSVPPLLQTRPPRPVWEAVRSCAAAAGLSAAQYLADVAALHVGRPDLVRNVGKGEGLPLAM
ncbi:Uncharacterised protein [Mycobacteroides abscessus subsp. abscessus]|nr:MULTISPECIES: hypothetical protein [Mycobacteriaceae]UGT84230.1 hypothetical protein LTS70_28285 [Mycobacterium kansasii]UGT89559.1 hypothetical protein LTT71_28285 [Mycobacterium kansasii]SIE16738.1 Uncharacterised protein [Mycobacteroides abscessus subsp. abscessus]SIG02623.1 Uncharacterised protein [Mycobacteroides abscessus subsp. abscessus]SIG55552.1 Uncharacterised protein [Mycobacteroides abscessus subsp. abscessus]